MAVVDAEAPFLEGKEEPLAGVSDFRGRPVYRATSGGWRSAIFVIANKGSGAYRVRSGGGRRQFRLLRRVGELDHVHDRAARPLQR
uniref:Uncharacterized protein n=1 Tax=Aegilops tauschii subsp. strangulata TaxID=200361 RepID=A0A453DJU9_AEGTS